MNEAIENGRFVKRAYWLIKLRWMAVISVAAATFISSHILGIGLAEYSLYGIAVFLGGYNAGIYLLLRYYSRKTDRPIHDLVKKTISFQICADLLILTILIHFSGGIENPFVFYFIFHMILASIMLPVRESYLQATYAALLLGLLLLLEFMGWIPHYCLTGYVVHCQLHDGTYILGTYTVFVSVLYLTVYMANDISKRLRQAEQAYRLVNKQLREKDRIKDEYVFRITHDIKGHLAAIQNCLDISRLAGQLNDEQLDFIGRAYHRAGKLMDFVNALLRLTRMRLSHNLEIKIFSVPEIIRTVMDAVEPQATGKSLALNYRAEISDGQIQGNSFSIEEMISNLVLNSIKYTPAGGTVEVIATEDENNIKVEIRDTGIGIPKEELPKIFDEFYRAKNAQKVEKDGTGLGLSIVKQIIERHKGKIWVESEEGVGTSFQFILPKAERSEKPISEIIVNQI